MVRRTAKKKALIGQCSGLNTLIIAISSAISLAVSQGFLLRPYFRLVI